MRYNSQSAYKSIKIYILRITLGISFKICKGLFANREWVLISSIAEDKGKIFTMNMITE